MFHYIISGFEDSVKCSMEHHHCVCVAHRNETGNIGTNWSEWTDARIEVVWRKSESVCVCVEDVVAGGEGRPEEMKANDWEAQNFDPIEIVILFEWHDLNSSFIFMILSSRLPAHTHTHSHSLAALAVYIDWHFFYIIFVFFTFELNVPRLVSYQCGEYIKIREYFDLSMECAFREKENGNCAHNNIEFWWVKNTHTHTLHCYSSCNNRKKRPTLWIVCVRALFVFCVNIKLKKNRHQVLNSYFRMNNLLLN